MRNDSKTSNKEFCLPKTSAADLMGKQSVRATFKLSTACIDAISILSAQLGKLGNLFHSILLLAAMMLVLSLLGWLFAGSDGMKWVLIIGAFSLVLSPNLSPYIILR